MNYPSGFETPQDEERDAERYRRLVESVGNHAIFELDTKGVITVWPSPAAAVYGYEADAVVGRPLSVLFRAGDAPAVGALLDDAGESSVEVDCRHERADGSTFHARLVLSPIRGDALEGYAVVSRDRTDEQERERRLQRQNERLREFTDGLAHDLRNPLTLITGRLELARETGDPEHLDRIGTTVDRMERLLDDLLRFARQGEAVIDPSPTDLEAAVETAWEATGGVDPGATLRHPPLPMISADRDRLCELLENLFRNAVGHGSRGPDANARSAAVEQDSMSQDAVGETDAGPSVVVCVGLLDGGFYVADDGPGIPADLRAEVFDHGVTTADDGTGYGLSIVRTIAHAHDWDVAVTDGEAGGARFEFRGVDIS